MFALYEITDKGSSWIGPLTMGIISNYASIRWGLVYISLFFIIPLPILWMKVNIREGMEQAGRTEMVSIENKQQQDSPKEQDGVGTGDDDTSQLDAGAANGVEMVMSGSEVDSE